MLSLFDRLTRAAESRGWSPALALSAAAWVTALRLLGERFLAASTVGTHPAWHWFVHVFSFYLALLTTLGAVLARLVPVDWKRAQSLVGMGLLLGVLPPLIDALVVGRRAFGYEYAGGLSGLPWLLSGDPRALPPGETAVLWTSIAFMGLYTWRRSRSPARALAAAAASYGLVLFFLVGTMRLASAASQRTALAPSDWLVLELLAAAQLGLVIALGAERRLLARAPQVALPVLFVLLGAALRGSLDGPALLVAGFFGLMGLGFALSNDYYDRAEDALQGRTSPIDEGGAVLLSLVPLGGAAALLSGRLEAGLALVAFAVVAHAYHADPLRLKCVFPLSYKTEGLLAGLAMLAGLTCRPERPPLPEELWVVLAVGLGTPAALVFKDYKDVDADAAANVQTAFVFAERRGWPRRRVLGVAAVLLGVSLAVPCAWLVARGAPPALTAWLTLLALGAPLWLWFARRPPGAVLGAMLAAEATLGLLVAALLPP